MKTFKKAFYFPLLFLFLLFNLSNFAYAENVPYASVKIDANSTSDAVTMNGAILTIGNQLLCKTTADFARCEDPLTDGNNQNNYHTQWRTRIDDNVSHSNSMAKLVLEPDDTVVFARLYWSARAASTTDADSAEARDIKIKGPLSSTYTQLTSPVAKHGSSGSDYGDSADVTQYVINNGAGDYYVGDILSDTNATGIYASWQLVVVVQNPARSLKNMAIYDGYDSIHGTDDEPDEITVPATGFITPTGTDPFDASLFVYGGETDSGYGDSTWIQNGLGAWIALVDGENNATDVMNASVSSPDYPGGYRDGDASLADPNYRNVLGVDIDKLQINDKLNASKQTLSNSQTSTQIRLQSTGDRYSLIMFAFETEVFVPEFCYDYAYKQQGQYFTETNDGSQDPRLVGEVVNGEPVEVTIYLKSMVDGTIQIQDMNLNVSDINNSQADLNTSSIKLAKVGVLLPIIPSYTAGTVGGEDYINDIEIGTLDQNDYLYLYYTLNPTTTDLDMPITVEANYNLVLASASVPYTLRLSQDIPLCDGGSYDYSPYTGIFNVVHNNYYNNVTQLYNMPTQVTSRAGNFKVIATSEDDHDLLKPVNTIVAVELINAAAFQTTDASCRELDSAISDRVWVIFDNNSSEVMFDGPALGSFLGLNNIITSAAQFYAQANENTSFRVSYNEVKDNNGSLIDHTRLPNGEYIINNYTELVQDIGECSSPVQYPLGASSNTGTATMVAQACGQASDTNSISAAFYQACMECIYGYNTKFVCSRDNFAIRPEAFLLKLNDQNQTFPFPALRLSDNVSGVADPADITTQLAGGYNYKVDINATNHLDNNQTIGYTKTYDINSSTKLEYQWSPTGTVTGCNDFNSTSFDFRIVNGYIEMNSSLNQVGEYRFHMEDTTWTTVDNNPIYMGHHVGAYFLDPSSNIDCVANTSATATVTATTTNATPLNGCNISSNHNSSGSILKYRDYNVVFHPYMFDLTGITPTVGLTHDNVNATSFVYMSDMSLSPVDENMSYHLNGTIRAAGENNSSLSNFVDNCYAKPLNIDLNTNTLNQPVPYQFRFHSVDTAGADINTHDDNVSGTSTIISLVTADFPKAGLGSANTILNLNYDRNNSFAVNPEAVTFNNYNVDCTNPATDCTFNADLIANKTSSGTEDLNSSIAIRHYYGRTHAPRNRFVGPEGNVTIYYEVFCSGTTPGGSDCNKSLLQNRKNGSSGLFSRTTDDPRWFINEEHNRTAYGDRGFIFHKTAGATNVQHTAAWTTNVGTSIDTVSYQNGGTVAPRGYPYKATMDNNASGWLIYNKYNPTAIRNEFEVEFVSGTGTWAGKKESTGTTGEIGSKKTNRRSMW